MVGVDALELGLPEMGMCGDEPGGDDFGGAVYDSGAWGRRGDLDVRCDAGDEVSLNQQVCHGGDYVVGGVMEQEGPSFEEDGCCWTLGGRHHRRLGCCRCSCPGDERVAVVIQPHGDRIPIGTICIHIKMCIYACRRTC